MSTMKHGPYVAKVAYEDDNGMFRGSVINTRDVITFCSDSVAGLAQEFATSISEYLSACEEHGIEPAKTFSGQIPLRLTPELHGQVYASATDAGLSVSAYIRQALKEQIGAD